MAHWLLKSDPETYSFDDLLRDKTTCWDGIRNHQARNFLAQMKSGDECLIYHSGGEPGIVGTAKIARAGYPDPKADDPRWLNIDLRVGRRLPRSVPLSEIKGHKALLKMALVRQGRLSVTPVTDAEWDAVLALAAETA